MIVTVSGASTVFVVIAAAGGQRQSCRRGQRTDSPHASHTMPMPFARPDRNIARRSLCAKSGTTPLHRALELRHVNNPSMASSGHLPFLLGSFLGASSFSFSQAAFASS